MSRFTKYKLYQKYETRGSQEAIPCYPNVFSIDGDGTMPLVIVEENSRDCGYTGETQPIYRWYTLPIDTYYYCDACQDAQYKWVNLPISQDWECVGTTKYYKQKKQVSVDGGSTWTDVEPPQYQRGALYEQNSSSCGYRTRTTTGSPYCEQYDKYVDVYSQYSTDGGNTWQTTATTNVLLERYSSDCGYVPLTRWVESGWTCIGYDKYVNNVQQISYDNGQTWQNTSNTSASTLIEANSSDCGYEVKYRTTSGTSYCDGYSKYVPVYSQVSYDMGTTWETTATTNVLVESYSQDCGYVPLTRWVESGWTCVDYSKYVNNVQQISYDNGQTWENTTNTSASTLIEQYSYDCMDGVKLLSINDYGGITATPCNYTTALISSDVPIGYSTYIIGECVTEIKTHAFDSCSSLKSVVIPDSVTTLGSSAFEKCASLTSVTIGSGVTSINGRDFLDCTSLPNIVIPDNVTSIQGWAFGVCESLTSVTIGSGVTTIGPDAFSACGLTSLNIPSNVTTIDVGAFNHNVNLTSCTINNGVETIGASAFSNCYSLTTINIPNSVTSINRFAFRNCSGLTNVTIGSGIGYILEDAFRYCPSITSVTINATTPPTTQHEPFDYDSTFPIYVPCGSLDSYRRSAYWGIYGNRIQGIPPCAEPPKYRTISGDPYCEGYDKYVDVYSQVSYNGGYTWQTTATTPTLLEHNSLDCGYIPSSYKMFATYSDSSTTSVECDSSSAITEGEINLTNLVSVAIGDCITSIGDEAFRYCYSLTRLGISNSVTSIGERTFQACSGLTSCTIGSGVTSIGNDAFGFCSSLTSIDIPDSVTSIGTYAFYRCSGLTSVTVRATTPPTLGAAAFASTNSCPIYVPAASVETYKSASGWSSYASRIQAIP